MQATESRKMNIDWFEVKKRKKKEKKGGGGKKGEELKEEGNSDW